MESDAAIEEAVLCVKLHCSLPAIYVAQLLTHIQKMRAGYEVMADKLLQALDIAEVAQHERDWHQ